jgi:AI-2E family transporter
MSCDPRDHLRTALSPTAEVHAAPRTLAALATLGMILVLVILPLTLLKSSQFLAGQALNLGQNTLNFVLSLFVMLYLLIFLLRDGDALVETIRAAYPLRPEQLRTLASRFIGVIRATVKGTLVVAVVQGAR